MYEDKELAVVSKYLGRIKTDRAEAHTLPAVPAAVKRTSTKFADTQAQVVEAQEAVAAAKADLASAERDDLEAAKQAAVSGEKIPDPTAPQAQAAVEEAERRLRALTIAALDDGRVAFKDVVAHRDEWIKDLESEIASIREEIWRNLEAALECVPAAMAAEKVVKELQVVKPDRGEYVLPRFRPDLKTRPITAPVLDAFVDLGKAIQGVRGRFKTMRTIQDRRDAIDALRRNDPDEIRRLTAFK